MTIRQEVMIGLVYGALANLILVLVFLLRKTRVNEAYRRKIAHTAIYLYSLPAVFLFRTPVIAVSLAVLLQTSLVITRVKRIVPEISAPSQWSVGDLAIAPGLVVAWVFGQRAPLFYLVPLLVAAVADTAAWFIGTRIPFGVFRLFGSTKSVAGSTAFFVVSLAAVAAALLIDRQFAPIFPIALITAGVGTLAEVAGARGLDNFTVPVATAVVLATTAGSWG